MNNFEKINDLSLIEISLMQANKALERAKNKVNDPIYGVSIKTQGAKILKMMKSIEEGTDDTTSAELNSYVDQLNDLVAETEGLENKNAA